MGRYLNPGNYAFASARKAEYIDKTGLVTLFSNALDSEGKLFCVSRPRRFGKSMAAQMLVAYYGKGVDSRALFDGLEVSAAPAFEQHLNKHNVLFLDMTAVISQCQDKHEIVPFIMKNVNRELQEAFSVDIDEGMHLSESLSRVNLQSGARFIFIIDEWDAICRELTEDVKAFDDYVWLLRSLFKSDITARVFEGVYMTGILPIKKYGTQSALNNFDEYTMLQPGPLAPYFGFTEAEVRKLCDEKSVSFTEMKRWYDGYKLGNVDSIYNPNSVMKAIRFNAFSDYWASTSSYESIKNYISLNFDGLKDDILSMLGGMPVFVNPGKFQNDMVSVNSKDDVITLLIHLGYLGFDEENRTAFIPNYEISEELQNAVEGTGWARVAEALGGSMKLLEDTLNGDEGAVASALERIHEENTSVLQYNNENSLACAITIAYYSARRYYTIVREFPAGKGFADLVFIPVAGTDKPALLIELKYNKSAVGAIAQIMAKSYPDSLKGLSGDIILVGINYDKETKLHSCKIEKVSLHR